MNKTVLSICLSFVAFISMYGQQPTFVIVHGAWGGSWSFKKTDSLLTENGFNVYRPNLTGQGERVHLASPDIDLNTHILDVVNTILYEDLHDIILMGHSYGGMVITGVADSIPERISHLIYMDAFVPNDGESLITARKNENIGTEQTVTDGFMVPVWVNEADPLPHDVPQSFKTFNTPVSLKKKEALELPATYILTIDNPDNPEADHFYPFSVRAHERGWKVVNMVADHNPQQSKVNELVEILISNYSNKF